MKELATYLVLDESGAMHQKNDRYFVIAGFITTKLYKVRAIHRKIEGKIKKKNNISATKELKASYLQPEEKAEFINGLLKLNCVYPISIVIDKQGLRKKNIPENIAYNLLIKNLLKYILTYKKEILPTKDIILYLDNRSVKVKYMNELETYLEWELTDLFDKDFTVYYKNSKESREVQMADYLANAIYGKYNYINTEKTSSKIIGLESVITSRFPYKDFKEPLKIKKPKKLVEMIET